MAALYPFAGLIIAGVTLAAMYGGYCLVCLLDEPFLDGGPWHD